MIITLVHLRKLLDAMQLFTVYSMPDYVLFIIILLYLFIVQYPIYIYNTSSVDLYVQQTSNLHDSK